MRTLLARSPTGAQEPPGAGPVPADDLVWRTCIAVAARKVAWRSSMSVASPRPSDPTRSPHPYEFSEDHKDSFRALAASISFLEASAPCCSGGFSWSLRWARSTRASIRTRGLPSLAALSASSCRHGCCRPVGSCRPCSVPAGGDIDHLMAAVAQMRKLVRPRPHHLRGRGYLGHRPSCECRSCECTLRSSR